MLKWSPADLWKLVTLLPLAKPNAISADANFRKVAISVSLHERGHPNARQLLGSDGLVGVRVSMYAGHDDDRLRNKRELARRSAVRARILELYEQDNARSLKAEDLLDELREWFGEVSLSQIAYHLRWLRDGELIPPAT